MTNNIVLDSKQLPIQIYGIDFSGAALAGNAIWITEATADGETLTIKKCKNAAEFLDCSSKRELVLPTLCRFIADQKNAVLGLDVAFSIPLGMFPESTWQQFAANFPEKFASADQFRNHCRDVFPGSEVKRLTDLETQTPFSPYNLRMYRQTYYGIRDVLSPLVKNNAARVVPMQQPEGNLPVLLECCPASLLKKMKIYAPYKTKADQENAHRRLIFETIVGQNGIQMGAPNIRDRVLADAKGDALDSLLCTIIVMKQLCNPKGLLPETIEKYELEGMVYS
ncbi:MAG: hypothetical protein KDE52_00045 [Calditrichaeota bacterium]|nr:hypothetical protein [Calditrichota bacterium]